MKELTRVETSTLVGGDRMGRLLKQDWKCLMGSDRACRRAARMRDRMQ